MPEIPSVADRGRFVTTYAALIVGVALVAVVAALAYVHSRPTEYTSEVSVLVGSQVFANGVAEPPDMGTEKAVSSSGTVLSAAAERLGVPVDVLADGASARVPVDTHVLVLSQSASTAAAARRHTAARAAAYVEYRDQPQVPKLGATGEAARPSQTLRVITEPSTPTSPDEPNLVLVLTVALVLGGGLGLAAAVALDSGSDRIRGPGDLGRVSGLPVLAEVPGTLHPTRGIPVLDQQASRESDAYYRVTAATLTAASRRGTRVVLVTSGGRYDGVTTSAANIAVAMAESATKTLLVLADPLGPSLRQLMGSVIPPGKGPSPVGSEDASFGVLPGLRVADLTGGDRVPLRRGGDIAKAVAAAARQTVVVIAAPALLTQAGALSLAGKADVILLVADAQRSDRSEVRDVVAQLAPCRDRLLGALLVGRRWHASIRRSTVTWLARRSTPERAPAVVPPPAEVSGSTSSSA